MKNSILTETKLAQKCAKMDDPLDTYFTEPVAMLFSRLFLKLKIHPNIVTLFSVITGVCGGLIFISRKILLNVIGILLIIFSAIFDASDGQVARLGAKKSKYGRWIDGLGDSIVYGAIYFGISVRLMSDNIPFTDIKWGYYIWIFSAICGIFLHAFQAKMADYFRNIHMFVIKNKRGTSLERSKNMKMEYEKYNRFTIDRFFTKGSYNYTKSQEKHSPKTQKLLDAMEKGDFETSEKAKDEVAKTSNKFVWITNILTFNVRTYFLFILLALDCLFANGLLFCIFPFVILVLEPIKYILISIYERSAQRVYNKLYAKSLENSVEKVA